MYGIEFVDYTTSFNNIQLIVNHYKNHLPQEEYVQALSPNL